CCQAGLADCESVVRKPYPPYQAAPVSIGPQTIEHRHGQLDQPENALAVGLLAILECGRQVAKLRVDYRYVKLQNIPVPTNASQFFDNPGRLSLLSRQSIRAAKQCAVMQPGGKIDRSFETGNRLHPPALLLQCESHKPPGVRVIGINLEGASA